MYIKYFRFVLSAAIFLVSIYIFSSCNPSRRVQDGDFLLMKNKIELITMDKNDSLAPSKKEFKMAIDQEEVANLVRQVPNRKFVGLSRIYLGFYNMVSPAKMQKDIEKKVYKYELKNKKRQEKGKEDKKYKKPLRQWFAEDIGELPVIYDSSQADISVSQIENYLYNKGFFYPKVDYEVKKDSVKNRISVEYSVAPRIPYRINRIYFHIQNDSIKKIIFKDVIRKDSLIHHGDRFDLNNLQSYQKELSRNIRNDGYYMFNSSMIYFQADTNLSKHQVNLSLFVNDSRIGGSDEIARNANYYKKYYVENIYVNTSYPALKDDNDDLIPYDTLDYRNKNILYQHRFRYNPKLFQRSTLLTKDSLFSVDDTELSFKKLFELGSFDVVNISYNQTNVNDSISTVLPLNAFVNLNPARNQSVSFEATTTNNGGYLGVSGSVAYSHKNIFKGAEQLRISLSGGIEAQQEVGGPESSQYFNTIEIAPQIELIFPHFVAPFSYTKFKRILNPKTSIAINFNYQDRPDYQRTTTTAYYAYKWNSKAEISHQLNVVQMSFTKIDKTQAFQDYLDGLNNKVLEASYEDNVVPSIRYIGIYNNQKSTFQRDVFFAKFFLQEAGSVTRLLFQAFDGPQNEEGQYLFSGIPFANFIKTEIDLRIYRNFDENNALAARMDIGAAWTLKNLDVMPFTDAFFVGGSNSNRAWRPRTLGPGSYKDTTGVLTYDKIGDIKIDLSLEYRFNLVSIIDLGIFIDASNVWYLKKEGLSIDDPGVFNVNRFVSEIAFGTGFGVRLNFNFFLIRFDYGIQTKDPSYDKGKRWVFQRNDGWPPSIFNIAIGYPF